MKTLVFEKLHLHRWGISVLGTAATEVLHASHANEVLTFSLGISTLTYTILKIVHMARVLGWIKGQHADPNDKQFHD